MVPHSRHYGVLLLTRSNELQSLRTIVFNLAIIRRPLVYDLLDDIPTVAELHIVIDFDLLPLGNQSLVHSFVVLSYGGVRFPKLPRLKTFKVYGSVLPGPSREPFGTAVIAMMETRWRQGDNLGSCKLSVLLDYLAYIYRQSPHSAQWLCLMKGCL